jgi:hypothetical protein
MIGCRSGAIVRGRRSADIGRTAAYACYRPQ